MKVSFDELKIAINRALVKAGVKEEDAQLLAEVHAVSTLKGVNSHGLNRVPRLIDFIHKGWVVAEARMELVNAFGAIENYDGNLGFGVINALDASDRAVELAKEHGIAMVSLKNTTHWMRGGTYAERIADQGFIGMVWTNTESVLPVWGAKEASIGNNPLAIGIPSKSGKIALDIAFSQYSLGSVETARLAGKELPYPGGFDKEGNLTRDPKAIEDSKRHLPIGYWKGSGLAIALDTMAALMAQGQSGADMDESDRWNCTACSQVFIAMNPLAFSNEEENERIVSKIKKRINEASPAIEGVMPLYPGQGMEKRVDHNLQQGIEVDEGFWKQVLELGK